MDNISIIMCCYNSEKKIEEALDYLSLQELPNDIKVELLIIDNNSSDNTQEVARNHWVKIGSPFEMKIIFEPQQGIIFARKTGVKNANGDLILFVDDDNLLCPNYLLEGIKILNNNPKIGVAGGFGIEKINGKIPKWINPGFPFKSLLNALAITTNSTNKSGLLDGKDEFIFGAASFYRKNIFDTLNSLSYNLKLIGRSGDVLLSGEDQELCYIAKMMGYQLFRSSDISFQHAIPLNRLDYSYYKKLYHGFGFSSFILFIYSDVLQNGKFTHNFNKIKSESFLKKLFFDGLYLICSINKQKFFKFALLSSYEKGLLAYLKKENNIKKTITEIEELYINLLQNKA